jgi:FkbM family methyltransferase
LHYAPNGQHVAFEPSIIKSTWLKSHFPHAEIFPYAVAETSGTAIFQENMRRPGYSHLQGAPGASSANTNNYEVKACCLDDVLIGRNKIDLIKLDIEGGELAALRGAEHTIKKLRPALIFECGSEYAFAEQKFSLHRQQLYDFITGDLNYDIFCFSDFLFEKGPILFDEFRKCGLYPFRAFNFVALSRNRGQL